MAKQKNGSPAPATPSVQPEAEKNAAQPEKPVEPDYLDQLLRLKAEFENYRKRVDREKPEYINLGKTSILAKLLPFYDLLQKAHQEVLASHNDTPLAKGMEGIFKEFDKLFREEGVAAMDPLNKPFDANQHEVFGTVDREDVPEGTVADVLQNGFLLQDRVLRTAKVRITRRPKKEDGPAQAGA
ncbi:MAG: nucleotide exchange factor GrpE [Elusimicrobia bacterium]|nr:nucleotide exchange factor GrpE [Elusimicrobiota bacterium]